MEMGGLEASRKDAGCARHFFSQLRRQLGQAPRGSGWSAASCGGAGALQGALHMPRALWVAANAGAQSISCPFSGFMRRFMMFYDGEALGGRPSCAW